MVNPYQALIDGATLTKQNLVDTVEARTAFNLASPNDIQTLDTAPFTSVIVDNTIFDFDAADVVSAHDGSTVLVSQDGRRYKSDTFPKPFSVLDRLTTPPGGPSSGDAYLVTSPATGDWVGEENSLTFFTLNGWKFVQPVAGMNVLVEDESQFYFFDTDNSWKTGLGLTFSISSLDFPLGVAVEAEQDDPPVTPIDGTAFIVGGSPTGAFVSHETEVALRISSAWVFLVPYAGAVVFDKNLIRPRRFDGSAWVPLVPESAAIAHRTTSTTTDFTVDADTEFWDYGSLSSDLATDLPDQTEGEEALTITHTADATDNELVFQWAAHRTVDAQVNLITGAIVWFAVFIDSETTPRDILWLIADNADDERNGRYQGHFVVPAIDTASHTYRFVIGLGGSATSGSPQLDFTSARLNMTEYAVTT